MLPVTSGNSFELIQVSQIFDPEQYLQKDLGQEKHALPAEFGSSVGFKHN